MAVSPRRTDLPRFIALIPARGGSKGVVRKNLRTVGGKPLIAHTIEAARASAHIGEVYVSSDDAEILAVAETLGCVPVERPAAYATDEATAVDVVKHFLRSTLPDARGENPSIVYLQPTSPLRTARHIDAAVDAMLDQNRTCLVSVTELEKSPFKSFTIDGDGALKALFDEKLSNYGRQSLPRTYAPNGAIYVFDCVSFLERDGFPSTGSVPFLMSTSDSIDIDSEDDLRAVQSILETGNG
ncbi:cytidylyltransferase domain-containing protein [Bradyrhizobium symbiodeficiens]|uniref:acylneuraminate cytidylyltransferase family protein n=1 Tax=Bradyrhizobium symbiodeficiens TaxID=1404367 RepID=UPI00140FA874|nr:acylneuraminate cytidylyltransferase family protein [Bradyrhizobium symbiodeficiens]QIP01751.1 acylneuraminate cytidylyltransferase family protein [Bradyrhizobium symbiodeficiens]